MSVATTLNVYTHITDDMKQAAAQNIDRGIAKAPNKNTIPEGEEKLSQKHSVSDFQPYKGQRRKSGAGCISQIGDYLFEGRYSPRLPDGKRYVKNVYAPTREECESKLAKLIVQMKAEIAEMKTAQKRS